MASDKQLLAANIKLHINEVVNDMGGAIKAAWRRDEAGTEMWLVMANRDMDKVKAMLDEFMGTAP